MKFLHKPLLILFVLQISLPLIGQSLIETPLEFKKTLDSIFPNTRIDSCVFRPFNSFWVSHQYECYDLKSHFNINDSSYVETEQEVQFEELPLNLYMIYKNWNSKRTQRKLHDNEQEEFISLTVYLTLKASGFTYYRFISVVKICYFTESGIPNEKIVHTEETYLPDGRQLEH